jgi:hypothetical protein
MSNMMFLTFLSSSPRINIPSNDLQQDNGLSNKGEIATKIKNQRLLK